MAHTHRSPLDLDEPTMRALGRRVADLVAEHLSGVDAQPVTRSAPRPALAAVLGGPPPEAGTDFEALLGTLRDEVFPYHAREPHPGFMGYVPGCPTFPAVLGDWIATGFNFFAGVWSVAAGPNALELAVLDWFREWIGMPAGSGGLLTSGGSQATLTAIAAARHRVVGDDAALLPKLALYTSDQAHSSVARAAWIAGIPRANVRAIATDDAFRMDVDALARAVADDRARGLVPFLVAASAGTTNTGAVDPLDAIADFCARESLWMHVDAAYAGFAALTEDGRRRLAGLGRADTVTLDPHKWLFVPFECGCLLARDPARLSALFRIFPEYLKDVEAGAEEVNFADYGEQLTRYARALKIWLPVRYFGLAAIRDAIAAGVRRAERAEEIVRAAPELEVLSPAQFGILCFRARLPEGDPSLRSGQAAAALDALNERINARVNAAGRWLVSSTRLRGAFSLRLCVPGFRTTDADVEALIAAVTEAVREESVVSG